MPNIRWGARFDEGKQSWILARTQHTGGLLCVRKLRITCETLAEQDGHLEFMGEVIVNGSTVSHIKEPVMVADSAWIRHLEKVDQVVHVKRVAVGVKALRPRG
jgi:hypothetical protein